MPRLLVPGGATTIRLSGPLLRVTRVLHQQGLSEALLPGGSSCVCPLHTCQLSESISEKHFQDTKGDDEDIEPGCTRGGQHDVGMLFFFAFGFCT